MRWSFYIYSIALLLIFALSLVTDWYDQLIYCINVIAVLMVIDKLGKGIVLREIIALHSCFICLLMPLIGYLVYNENYPLAAITRRYMPVPKELYFSFALPAVTAFSLFLCWPISNSSGADNGQPLEEKIRKARSLLENHKRLGLYLLIMGVFVTTFVDSVPVSIRYIFSLLYFAAFAGCLYIYFTKDFPYKKIILSLFGLFIVAASLRNGMFTIIAYMGMTLFSFFFLGNKSSIIKKLTIFILGMLLLTLIQSVKPAYRRMLKMNYHGDKVEMFAGLLEERVTNVDKFISVDALFPLHYRANQGFNMALVMKRFPILKPYDNGSNLLVVAFASLVPRLLWPDKPEAGGIANMKYYAGVTIKGWSTNVGPLGEAYASFGSVGGIVFMSLLGFFIRLFYKRIFVIANKIPLIIFWIPVMFYQVTYSAENDTFQILNSLIKSSFFVFLLYKFIPSLFIASKKQNRFTKKTIVRDTSLQT